MKKRAFIVAGTHSGSGKTILSLGLMAALNDMGFAVQPFKVGPDYIDPGLHSFVCDRPSRNLDLWMCSEDYVRDVFKRHLAEADIGVVEGVMGLFDGDTGTWKVAQVLDIPIVLVVDAYGLAETVGAILKGILWEARERDLRIMGVIFTRVGSERHFNRLCSGISKVPVLGFLPREEGFSIPSRHLGLMVAEESPISDESLNALIRSVKDHIDVEGILELSQLSPDLYCPGSRNEIGDPGSENYSPILLVARDKAFCFYYQDNLDLLEELGVRLRYFSPISDKHLPNCDGLYLGGGYPEVYAKELSSNIQLLNEIRELSRGGMPIYGECGGLMYLSKGLIDKGGGEYEMAGVLPFWTTMAYRGPVLGYREVELTRPCILGQGGEVIRGHEFHYSRILGGEGPGQGSLSCCFLVRDPQGFQREEGYLVHNTLATYVHLHFGRNKRLAENWVKVMRGEGIRWR